jgi:hypothetical protein
MQLITETSNNQNVHNPSKAHHYPISTPVNEINLIDFYFKKMHKYRRFTM